MFLLVFLIITMLHKIFGTSICQRDTKKDPLLKGKKMRLLVTNFHLVELTAAFGDAVEIAPELSSGDRKSIAIANHFLKQEISKTTKKKMTPLLFLIFSLM